MLRKQRTTRWFWSCSSQSNGDVSGRRRGGGKLETRYDITSPAPEPWCNVSKQPKSSGAWLCSPVINVSNNCRRGEDQGIITSPRQRGCVWGILDPPAQPPLFKAFIASSFKGTNKPINHFFVTNHKLKLKGKRQVSIDLGRLSEWHEKCYLKHQQWTWSQLQCVLNARGGWGASSAICKPPVNPVRLQLFHAFIGKGHVIVLCLLICGIRAIKNPLHCWIKHPCIDMTHTHSQVFQWQ